MTEQGIQPDDDDDEEDDGSDGKASLKIYDRVTLTK